MNSSGFHLSQYWVEAVGVFAKLRLTLAFLSMYLQNRLHPYRLDQKLNIIDACQASHPREARLRFWHICPPSQSEALLSTPATTAPTRGQLHPQGPSARRTAQCAVLSEDGRASACPRAFFQGYFPNARSAVGNPEAHCHRVALDAAFVCAAGAGRKHEAGRMRAMLALEASRQETNLLSRRPPEGVRLRRPRR